MIIISSVVKNHLIVSSVNIVLTSFDKTKDAFKIVHQQIIVFGRLPLHQMEL